MDTALFDRFSRDETYKRWQLSKGGERGLVRP